MEPDFDVQTRVFPARAGMNRMVLAGRRLMPRVPRASGDEPIVNDRITQLSECSPRERG